MENNVAVQTMGDNERTIHCGEPGTSHCETVECVRSHQSQHIFIMAFLLPVIRAAYARA